MKQPVTQLTQSRYYSPAFNAAIFDGPLRIYFAQYQEALALKIYFRLQDRVTELYQAMRQALRSRTSHIFVMLYPTEEIFSNCFSKEQCEEHLVVERLGDDYVIGICGPLHEEDYNTLYDLIPGCQVHFPASEATASL